MKPVTMVSAINVWLFFAFIFAGTVGGSEGKVQGNPPPQTVYLTDRQSRLLCYAKTRAFPDYQRFAAASTAAKPAFYEMLSMHKSNSGILLGMLGDESDLVLLEETVRVLPGAKNPALVANTVLALVILGDRGYSAAYALLDKILEDEFLRKMYPNPDSRDQFIWGTATTLRWSKYPRYLKLLERFASQPSNSAAHRKLVERKNDYVEDYKTIGDTLRRYRIPTPEKDSEIYKASLDALRDKNAKRVSISLMRLSRYQSSASVALPKILDVLKTNENENVIASALIVISGIGPLAKGATGTVRQFLKHESMVVRVNAILSLARVGDSDGIHDYLKTIALKDPAEQLYALAAIGMLNAEPSPETSEILVEILVKDPTEAIKEINPLLFDLDYSTVGTWPSYVPEIIKTAPKNGAPLKCAAAFALSRSELPVTADIVKKALASDNRQLKVTILESMSLAWKDRKELIPIILPYLGDKDDTISTLAMEALGNIGIVDSDCCKAVATRINTGSFWKNIQIIRTLGKIGTEDWVDRLKKRSFLAGSISPSVGDLIVKKEVAEAIKAIGSR